MTKDVVVVGKDGSSEISVIIRTADQTRKADVSVPVEEPCSELINGAIENWELDQSGSYTINNVTKNIALDPDEKIGKTGTENGDILEIQPVLVAGYEC